MGLFTLNLKQLFVSKNRVFGLVLIGLGALVLFAPIPFKNPEPQHRTVRIEASQYSFTPSVVHINPGDQVTVELVSIDVVHGFSLDGHQVQITADPGRTTRVTFTAGPAGVYRFRCSVACGNLHPFMIGKFRIGPNPLWIRGSLLALAAVFAALLTHNRAEVPA